MSNKIPQRTNDKKSRKMNKVLNISIGLVVLLIVVVSTGLLVSGGGSSNTASEESESQNNASEESVDNNISLNTETSDSENEGIQNELNAGPEGSENLNNEENQEADEESENNSSDENNANENNQNNQNNVNNGNDQNSDNSAEENEENSETNEVPEEGEWEPIGTSQDNFQLDFERGSTNWNEMIEAISYATGLPSDEDELIVHRLENGGDQYSVVGTVRDRDEDRDRPYQVRLEWVEDEGWKPVSVERLESNPY
ncbi:YrrS family protein [Alkalicoccus halolimnae]|uniref:YrrS family protein n=1 Tax=Alkalicoccus halolimnae TaxID=1667239 RepID=A0A5C7FK32_9BACI|nr:YrrS family protein [Alkalicoccus halolimnae]TXF86489.1 DUF1510 family protein [Alkalicoccus halolimnae]